jgi:2-polyprenyl-6-methoxyphenol hydroxylase-like FAD-dependent oxidoreductase
MQTTIKGRRALVLGGGIAGLGAAGALARHFEEVQVAERDPYPDEPAARPHAPQGAHVHVLLAKGLEVLSRRVPELTGWLDQMGLHEGDLTEHVRTAYAGRWLPRTRSGIPFRPCTRPEIEHLLRRDVERCPNVTILREHKAERLLGRERVTGARVSHAGGERDIQADLVVDAMGRASPSARWLSDAGMAPPTETVDAGVVYTSCLFEPPARIDDDWIMLGATAPVLRDPHMSALMRLGPGRLLCAFIAYGNEKPPRTAEELVACTAGLCVPEIHRLLRACRPMSAPVVFNNTLNRWRHFARIPTFPDGLVCIGDAACTLNPRYGQGMTVAALSADRLDAELTGHFLEHARLEGFSRRFQQRLDDILKVPWQLAVMEDRLWVSASSGKAPRLSERIVMKGSGPLLHGLFSNMEAYIQFMRVAHLIDPPTRMLSPRILGAIAKGGALGGVRAPAPHIGAAV